MSDIVLLHHNEPMTTSLAIAEGTENTHQAIMKMVKTYVAQLQEFGEVGFQIRLNPQGSPTEFAFLNEPQATLLITFLRNSEIVVKFKVALVKAFYELRGRAVAAPPAAPSLPDVFPGHGADRLVAADRTFRALMRSAKAMGESPEQAARRARAGALRLTGMDVVSELGIAYEATLSPREAIQRFLGGFDPAPFWDEDRGRTDYWQAYHNVYLPWCREKGVKPVSEDWFISDASLFFYRRSKAA
jgi:hypothetical protein